MFCKTSLIREKQTLILSAGLIDAEESADHENTHSGLPAVKLISLIYADH
jgi:hypothetical protein